MPEKEPPKCDILDCVSNIHGRCKHGPKGGCEKRQDYGEATPSTD